MQKIAFHLNSLQQGGAERVVSNLANRFAKEGYEVVIATEWYGTDEFALDQKVRRVHVGLTKEDENRSRISKMLRRIWYLRRFMKKEKPDVVVAFTRGVLYRALAAGIGTGIPVVISVRTDPVGHYDKKADKLRIPLLFPHAAGCVFQTEGAKAFFAPYLQENSRIILNPLNPKYVGVPEPAVRTKDVVQSGRLVDFKNQPMLIRAFLKVHEKRNKRSLPIGCHQCIDLILNGLYTTFKFITQSCLNYSFTNVIRDCFIKLVPTFLMQSSFNFFLAYSQVLSKMTDIH